MPVQTEYNLYTRDEVVGNLYGLSYTNSVRHSYANTAANGTAGAEVGFGLAVQRTTLASDPSARTAILGVNATPDAEGDNPILIDGLSIRSINRMMQDVPGSGSVGYQGHTEMAVLHDGYIHVAIKAGTAVRGAQVFVDPATGEFHGAAIAGTTVLATNVVFDRDNAAGEIGLVRIMAQAV